MQCENDEHVSGGNIHLRPSKPLAAKAIAKGEKPSALTKELQHSVDLGIKLYHDSVDL